MRKKKILAIFSLVMVITFVFIFCAVLNSNTIKKENIDDKTTLSIISTDTINKFNITDKPEITDESDNELTYESSYEFPWDRQEIVYIAALPRYGNKEKQIKITEEMKNQGYFDKGQKIYYFRITKAQYDELTKDYFEADRLSEIKKQEVSYTYDDLFIGI